MCRFVSQKIYSIFKNKIFIKIEFNFVTEMEIVPEGKHFRLLREDELPAILDFLEQYLPESLKVI